MDVRNIKLVVTRSDCKHYKVGDEIYFDGAVLNKEKSGKFCMMALVGLYPFVYAARKGGEFRQKPLQCQDCGSCVEFVMQEYEREV